MLSEQVLLALISAISGIVIAFISMYFRNKAVESKNVTKPKDRMEIIFEGYEKLIKEQQLEIDRKGRAIEHYEKLVETHEKQVDALKGEIEALKEELETVRESRQNLQAELEGLKSKYGKDFGGVDKAG